MEWFQSIFLGIIQGLTEFLPVSSSGHITIFQHFMGIRDLGLGFEVLLHFAALLSIIICYRKDVWELICHPFQKYVLLIIVACIPMGLAGIFFNSLITQLFSSVWVPAIALLFTAGILYVAVNFRGNKFGDEIDIKTAVFIGLFQILALVPGISRPGITIFAALLFGMRRTEAAKFSFIMSIPVILVASLLKILNLVKETGTFAIEPIYLAGSIVAFLAGIIAINLVTKLLRNDKFIYFAKYCIVFSVITIILLCLGM